MLPNSAASSSADHARGRAFASRRRRCRCQMSVAIAMAALLVISLATILVLQMMPGRPGVGARSALRAAKQRVVKALEAAQDGGWPPAKKRANGQGESRPPVQEDDRHHLDEGSFGNVGGVGQPVPPAPLVAAVMDKDKDKDKDKENVEMEYVNERWRGNNYVRQRGVLPYERCGAGQFSPGPRPTISDFQFAGETYSLVMLGATTWGASDETGKPTAAESVQLLLYWQHKKDRCDVVHASKHCILPDFSPPPRLRCRIQGEDGGWKDGWRDPRPNSTKYRLNVPVDPVYCPLPRGVDSLQDRFVLELQFGDEAGEHVTTRVDMCYLHVRRAVEVYPTPLSPLLFSSPSHRRLGFLHVGLILVSRFVLTIADADADAHVVVVFWATRSQSAWRLNLDTARILNTGPGTLPLTATQCWRASSSGTRGCLAWR